MIENLEEISSVLTISYYDRWTDAVWKYVFDKIDTDNLFFIHSLSDFEVMLNMLKFRKTDVKSFLADWKQSDKKIVTECKYDESTGILNITTRTMVLFFNENTPEFGITVNKEIADAIHLENQVHWQEVQRPHMFRLTDLEKLDKELYRRYSEKLEQKEWIKTEKFQNDVAFCKQMLPVLQEHIQTRKDLFSVCEFELNIILCDNDKVRIDFIEDYTPEEMMGMHVYQRSEWKDGINKTFEKLDLRYEMVRKRAIAKAVEWNDVLISAMKGEQPYEINIKRYYSEMSNPRANKTEYMVHEAFNIKLNIMESPLNRTIFDPMLLPGIHTDLTEVKPNYRYFDVQINKRNRNVKIVVHDEIAEFLIIQKETILNLSKSVICRLTLEELDRDIETFLKRRKSFLKLAETPEYQKQLEAIRYIIETTAPIICYTGECELMKDISLIINTNDYNSISTVIMSSAVYESKIFKLDDFKNEFRIWWSKVKLLLIKTAKLYSQEPNNYIRKFNPEWLLN